MLPSARALTRSLSRAFATSASRWSSAPLLLSPTEAAALSYSNPAKTLFLDATWFMPNSPRNVKKEFTSRRLPDAQFFDLDDVASSHELGLKHMLPDAETFSKACGSLGISPDTHVIIYDTHGVFSSPRALFTFRTFGHQASSVLNGGLPRWIDEGHLLEQGSISQPKEADYAFQSQEVSNIACKYISDLHPVSYEDVVSNSKSHPSTNTSTKVVLDARANGRFTGVDPEPRPGLSSGHIPNSFSLPFNLFLRKQQAKDGSEYTVFRGTDEIRGELEKAVGSVETQKVLEGRRSVITTCGSGMTAGVLWLGLKLLNVPNVSLYDESWTGYAMRPASEIHKA